MGLLPTSCAAATVYFFIASNVSESYNSPFYITIRFWDVSCVTYFHRILQIQIRAITIMWSICVMCCLVVYHFGAFHSFWASHHHRLASSPLPMSGTWRCQPYEVSSVWLSLDLAAHHNTVPHAYIHLNLLSWFVYCLRLCYEFCYMTYKHIYFLWLMHVFKINQI